MSVKNGALISTHDGDPASYTWMDDSVFAIELKPQFGGRVVRLAHTQSLVDENMEHDYWAEPQATANRDFTRILFTSNWGRSGTGEVEMFIIQLPEGWMSFFPGASSRTRMRALSVERIDPLNSANPSLFGDGRWTVTFLAQIQTLKFTGA